MAQLDPHSYSDASQPDVTFVELQAKVDFQAKVLDAQARLQLNRPHEGPLDLDTRDLDIRAVTRDDGQALPFELGIRDDVLGTRLRVRLPAGTSALRISYRTSPAASALQWLEPTQTLGGKAPFLFSQCQPIHARSVLPVQDTPRVRVRYRAELTVPKSLRAVMAARFLDRTETADEAVERYEMTEPIPPYLFAFAVGELTSKDLGPRSRVWAEPGLVDAAAWEFAEVEKIIGIAETLFGPYDWERFDILTMPPSFPYGGMENPRLTFLTPTLLAKDRSLVNVLAHELAHSWTGNLVTNSNAEHFWLNEGFTVYAERRILEASEGTDVAALHAALGRRALEEALGQFEDRPELTHLRTHLQGVDPDEAYSVIPYEKGCLFLRTLEEAVGRERFDAFLRKYLSEFRFRSLRTEDFLDFTEKHLPGALKAVNAAAWIDGPGIPANAPQETSSRLEAVTSIRGVAAADVVRPWKTVEWQLYLESQPRPFSREFAEALEKAFRLTESSNAEILVCWLERALEAGLPHAAERTQQVLRGVGRMKYLKPLYQALARHDPALARQVFHGAHRGYHPIAQRVIDGQLKATAV